MKRQVKIEGESVDSRLKRDIQKKIKEGLMNRDKLGLK